MWLSAMQHWRLYSVFLYAVVLVVSGLLLLWFRISMNYNSDPIFKSEELKAAFHPNRSVRWDTELAWLYFWFLTVEFNCKIKTGVILILKNIDFLSVTKNSYRAENIQHTDLPLFLLMTVPCVLSLPYHFRVMSFSNIYTINAWLLLAPSSLCCDWSLGSVPLVTSIADIRNVWSIVLYIGLLTLVLHTLRSRRYK